jgi:hypothetical protein
MARPRSNEILRFHIKSDPDIECSFAYSIQNGQMTVTLGISGCQEIISAGQALLSVYGILNPTPGFSPDGKVRSAIQ